MLTASPPIPIRAAFNPPVPGRRDEDAGSEFNLAPGARNSRGHQRDGNLAMAFGSSQQTARRRWLRSSPFPTSTAHNGMSDAFLKPLFGRFDIAPQHLRRSVPRRLFRGAI